MNIVITGASKGIGFELAKLFAKNQDNKVIAIARSNQLLKKLEDECNQNIIPIEFDLEDVKNIENKLISVIRNHFNAVDILINNAGYLMKQSFVDSEIDKIQKTFNINFISHSILIQKLIPILSKSKIKHVINISSMGGFQGSAKFPGLSFYSSSKAALANLTECLAEEFKNDGIKFNCLALGSVNTEMLKEAFPDYKAPVNANEMAQFIYDFALNGYQYFNGKILPVSISTP